jgi:hypothetical protein
LITAAEVLGVVPPLPVLLELLELPELVEPLLPQAAAISATSSKLKLKSTRLGFNISSNLPPCLNHVQALDIHSYASKLLKLGHGGRRSSLLKGYK